jgi:hypothetical protein
MGGGWGRTRLHHLLARGVAWGALAEGRVFSSVFEVYLTTYGTHTYNEEEHELNVRV